MLDCRHPPIFFAKIYYLSIFGGLQILIIAYVHMYRMIIRTQLKLSFIRQRTHGKLKESIFVMIMRIACSFSCSLFLFPFFFLREQRVLAMRDCFVTQYSGPEPLNRTRTFSVKG